MSATKTGENVNMKKIVLSTLVALSIATVASATDVKLYQDANGQVFTSAADGRTEISTPSTGVSVNSMTKNLDFSMLAYLGFDNTDFRTKDVSAVKQTASNSGKFNSDQSQFELRRMYFQVKAHVFEDPKSYFRITYDINDAGGYYDANVKYAYLFLADILPFTDVEIGQAHTTLLDYEESHSWLYRSFDNVFTEQKNAGQQNASGDRGIDLKTNTKYFSSEIGVYNGEGYHVDQPVAAGNNAATMGMDYEARLTAHLLGTGTDYNLKHTYFDLSLLGKESKAQSAGNDLEYVGVHSVFNMENFLIAGQYIQANDTNGAANAVSTGSGNGYSINTEGRMGDKDQYHVFARYDKWTPAVVSGATKYDKRTYILGGAYDMSKNIQLQANVITIDNQNDKKALTSNMNYINGNEYMLTAQVQF